MAESWEIWMDGEQVTLEDLRALLDSGDYDPDHTILVDDTPITLGNVKTILEIEEYIAYLRATYFNGQEWTAEQRASLQSLMDQIESEGIMMLGLEDEAGTPAFVDHTVTAQVTADSTAGLNSTYTFTVTLSKKQKQDVTFSYAAYSGSVEASGSGTVTIPAGGLSVTQSITVGGARGTVTADSGNKGTFVVSLYNLKNALFRGGATVFNQPVSVALAGSDHYMKAVTKSTENNKGLVFLHEI